MRGWVESGGGGGGALSENRFVPGCRCKKAEDRNLFFPPFHHGNENTGRFN